MCGVFGYASTDNKSASLVLESLKNLEYRGYDSWGVAIIASHNKQNKKSPSIYIKKQVGKIANSSVSDLPPGKLALGHTRWATHGGITAQNAHPHQDCTKKIALVHNGIFENYEEIKKQLLQKGHKFVSDTDSEVISHLIEEKMHDSDFAQAVRLAFMEMQGSNAIVAVHTDYQDIVAIRNGSPLVLGFGTNENYLASDPTALLPYTKEVYFLEDEEMAIISSNSVQVFDIHSQEVKTPSKQRLNWDESQADMGNYAYFMEKEIHEQPLAIASIATSASTQYKALANQIHHSSTTYLVGCGTASHAALVGFYLFSKISRHQVRTAVGSEFEYYLENLGEKDTVIALSQSGETMDLLEPLKIAKKQKVSIMAFVNVLGSSLYRLADQKISLGVGPEKAVASTKAFTGKVAHLILLAYAMTDNIDEGKKVLDLSVKSMEGVLTPLSIKQIKSLAKQFESARDIYVLGRGLSYPLSLETALKIKEISYIHAEGLATGELKHGTLALIEKGTPCIAFLPNDETYDANMAGVMEVKARGGTVIGVSHKPHQAFDYYIEVPDASVATIIPNAVVAQLLAYYLTIERGYDPDKPRNLAKSVTVK